MAYRIYFPKWTFVEKQLLTDVLLVSTKGHRWLHAPLKAIKVVIGPLLTMTLCVFQSIEREEPIEVDPAPTHAELENGHTATTGKHIQRVDATADAVAFRAHTPRWCQEKALEAYLILYLKINLLILPPPGGGGPVPACKNSCIMSSAALEVICQIQQNNPGLCRGDVIVVFLASTCILNRRSANWRQRCYQGLN